MIGISLPSLENNKTQIHNIDPINEISFALQMETITFNINDLCSFAMLLKQ